MYRAEEDYLKTIYELTVEKNQPLIKISELSAYMKLTDQTVNEMVKKLVAKKLLDFEPYKGVSLTPKGTGEALRMVRAHRIWEVFLTEKLGFKWSDVHEEAEMLEHSASERVVEKLNEYLGYPQKCGHGNPIPRRDGKVEEVTSLNMYGLEPGDEFRIVRVLDNKSLLTYLDDCDIRLGHLYKITKKDLFGGLIEITDGKSHILSARIAEMVFVAKIR